MQVPQRAQSGIVKGLERAVKDSKGQWPLNFVDKWYRGVPFFNFSQATLNELTLRYIARNPPQDSAAATAREYAQNAIQELSGRLSQAFGYILHGYATAGPKGTEGSGDAASNRGLEQVVSRVCETLATRKGVVGERGPDIIHAIFREALPMSKVGARFNPKTAPLKSGITRERVRQTTRNALRILRYTPRSGPVKAYLAEIADTLLTEQPFEDAAVIVDRKKLAEYQARKTGNR